MTAVKDEPAVSAFAPEAGGESAVDQLFALLRSEQRWDYDLEVVRELQLAAMSERLQQRRETIAALDQRADQVGLDTVERLEDASNLLFTGATYKTYPEAFVTKRQWPKLLRWLDHLATPDLSHVDVEDSADLDDFIGRLTAAGFPVLTTSGTSGKCSLLPATDLDMARCAENAVVSFGWAHKLDAAAPMPGFFLAKSSGPYRGTATHITISQTFVRPGAMHWLYDEPELVEELNRSSQLARRIAEGSATPSELSEARHRQQDAAEHTRQRLDCILDELLTVGDEPVLVWGTVYPNWLLVDRAAARKIDYRPNLGSRVHIGGGTKSNVMPPTFMDDLHSFWAGVHVSPGCYGQGEVISVAPRCDEGRYHLPPTTMVIPLTASGEYVVEPDGQVLEGLLGVFDIAQDGRWGGLLTADWLTIDLARCPCGLRSPAVTNCTRLDARTVTDDKISCAGRAEMYVRGV